MANYDLGTIGFNVAVEGQQQAIAGLNQVAAAADTKVSPAAKRVIENFQKTQEVMKRLEQQSQSLNRSFTFAELQRAAQRVSHLENVLNSTREGMGRFGFFTQQAGYQVGDFIVQVQSGTNTFVAFGQQATQLVGLLPEFAKELGIARVSFMGLSLSMASVTLGLSIIIPLVTAVGAAWMRTSEETAKGAKEQKNAYDQLRESLNQYIRAKEAASKGLTQDQLTVADQIANAQKTLDEAVLKLKEAREAYLTVATLTPGADVGLAPESNPALTKAIKDREDAQRTLNDLRTKMLDTYYKEAEELNKTNQLEVTKLLYGEKSVEYKKALAEEERRHYEESVRNLDISETYVQALLRQYDRMVANRDAAEKVSNIVDKIFESVDKASKVDLSKVFAEAAPFAQGLLNTVKDIYGKMLAAANVKAITEKNARESKDYSGRGGDPRDFMEGGSKSYNPNFRPFDPSMVPKSSKRGPSEDTINNKLEEVYKYLEVSKYQIEQENIAYSQRQDTLEAALQKKLLTQQEYNQLELDLAAKHAKDVADIENKAKVQKLSTVLGSGAQILEAIGQHNEKAAKMARVFGAAQALADTYAGAAAALKLPFPANLAAASSIIAAGLGFVNAIKSGSTSARPSSGSVARGSATVANSAPAQAPQTVYIDSIKPESLYSGETLIKLFDSFYDENDKRGKVFMVAR